MFVNNSLSQFFDNNNEFIPERFDRHVKQFQGTAAYRLAMHKLPRAAHKMYLKYLQNQVTITNKHNKKLSSLHPLLSMTPFIPLNSHYER